MQRHGPRHFTAYAITTVVYLAIVFAIYYSQTHHFVSSKKTKEKVLEMSLSTFVPEVVTPPKEKNTESEKEVPELIKEPIVKPIDKPIKAPVIEHVVKKPTITPIVKKVIIKKPVLKPVKKKVKKKPKHKKKAVVKKTKKKVKKKSTSKQISSNKAKKKSGGKKTWSALQIKINKHKMYPRIAKKRRMEGSVKIQFIVSASGNVKIVSISGRKIFYKSARNAVERAFPINPKKAPISLPSTITLNLHYKLRQ